MVLSKTITNYWDMKTNNSKINKKQQSDTREFQNRYFIVLSLYSFVISGVYISDLINHFSLLSFLTFLLGLVFFLYGIFFIVEYFYNYINQKGKEPGSFFVIHNKIKDWLFSTNKSFLASILSILMGILFVMGFILIACLVFAILINKGTLIYVPGLKVEIIVFLLSFILLIVFRFILKPVSCFIDKICNGSKLKIEPIIQCVPYIFYFVVFLFCLWYEETKDATMVILQYVQDAFIAYVIIEPVFKLFEKKEFIAEHSTKVTNEESKQ